MFAPETISVDNVKYVREDSVKKSQLASSATGLPVVIVRSQSAGVFFGHLVEQKERVVKMNHCRRLWYWSGAFSLSEMAAYGVSKPKACKFSCFVDTHLVLDAVEIIFVTSAAADIIHAVPEHKA